MKAKRIINYEGYRYLLIQDPNIARERRERDGYSKGYEDGEKFAILKPPTSLQSPLPSFNFEKLSKKYDQSEYRRGFAQAYYKKLQIPKES